MRTDGLAAALLAVAFVPATGAGSLWAQQTRAGFLTSRGADTVAVESVHRAPGTMGAELWMPGSVTQSYTASVTAAHLISRIAVEVRAPGAAPDAPPMQQAVVEFQGDTAVIHSGSGATAHVQRIATRHGALPFINLDWQLVEEAVARAHVLRGASDSTVSVPLFALAGGRTLEMTVAPLPADSALIGLGGVQVRAAFDAAGRMTGGTVPAQGLVIRRLATPPVRNPTPKDYSAPPGAPYTSTNVRVPSGNHVLAGTLTRPKVRGPVPAAVTITGSGPEDRDESLPGIRGYAIFRQIADTLGRRGIAVLRLDDRGYGASTGDFATATSRDFANDARAALAWLRHRPGIDGHRLALIGHSEGGLIAPMVAATDSSLAGIVLLAGPALTGRRIIRYQQRQAIDQDTSIAPARRDSMLAAAMAQTTKEAAHQPWLHFFMDYDPLPTARKVHVPVLILQGGTDWQVHPDQAAMLAAAFRAGGNRNVTVHLFPGDDHLFLRDPSGNPAGYASLPSKKVDPRVLGTLADWLAARLLKP